MRRVYFESGEIIETTPGEHAKSTLRHAIRLTRGYWPVKPRYKFSGPFTREEERAWYDRAAAKLRREKPDA